jgi:hypothetical protein
MSALSLCATVSLAGSVASSAAKPKRNKAVIVSSVVTSAAVAQATQVAVGTAVGDITGGPVRYPSTVALDQLHGHERALPGSWCYYLYANGGQGDPNTNGPVVVTAQVGFGPVTLGEWNQYEAFQRQHAFAGAAGSQGVLGQTGTISFHAVSLGGGSRAFEMSLSGYYENSSTQTPVVESEIFALSRHGNIVWVQLSPVLVTSSGETDSTDAMLKEIVASALRGSF